MSKTCVNISNKLNERTVIVFRAIDEAASIVGIPYFVVGAAARDIILQHAHGLKVRRATRDIDIAIRVESWEQYRSLTEVLEHSGKFVRSSLMHRFVFDGQESVDVVPFGPIAGDEGVITWPPGEDSALRILGFEEAFRGALLVRVSDAPILEVRVATLAGLVIMKLVSWDDGYPDRQRDAEDLNLILESYTEAGNFERLQNEAKDLLGGDSFDYVLAGARLLGRDVGMIAVGEIRKKIETILSREMNASGQLRLPLDMAKGGLSFQDHFDQALNLLSQLQRGLLEHGSRAEGLL